MWRFTEGNKVRKVVYVPKRLLNLVVGYLGSQELGASHPSNARDLAGNGLSQS